MYHGIRMGGRASRRKTVLGPLWQSLVAVAAGVDRVRYSSPQ
jgi:hypothetical protein